MGAMSSVLKFFGFYRFEEIAATAQHEPDYSDFDDDPTPRPNNPFYSMTEDESEDEHRPRTNEELSVLVENVKESSSSETETQTRAHEQPVQMEVNIPSNNVADSLANTDDRVEESTSAPENPTQIVSNSESLTGSLPQEGVHEYKRRFLIASRSSYSRSGLSGNVVFSADSDTLPEPVRQTHGQNFEARASKPGEIVCKCGSRCANLKQYKRHVEYFTEEGKFPCRFCRKQYLYYGHLKQHERMGHAPLWAENPRPEGEIGCRKCGQLFRSKLDLCFHYKDMHLIKPAQTELSESTSSDDDEDDDNGPPPPAGAAPAPTSTTGKNKRKFHTPATVQAVKKPKPSGNTSGDDVEGDAVDSSNGVDELPGTSQRVNDRDYRVRKVESWISSTNSS